MVGAAEGFGGKLMRTVSFLGWTLPVSFFGGGTAPPGVPGMFEGMSAIVFAFKINRLYGLSNSYSKENTRLVKNQWSNRPVAHCDGFF
jgi:hypothetical protein